MPLEITQEDFLSPEDMRRLKELCRQKVEEKKSNAVRNWAIIHVALDGGLRVSEICDLEMGDLVLAGSHSSIIVRSGKGDKKRGVKIGAALRDHLTEFISWKQQVGEEISEGCKLFLSARTKLGLTRSAVYRVFKQVAAECELPKRFSIHSCRHTYASMLYRASDYNIRLVQKQLGHSSIQTTQVYADVLDEDTTVAVNKLPQ